jgi:hypothetical protein
MRTRSLLLGTGLLAIVTSLVITGCSTLPTSPVVDRGAGRASSSSEATLLADATTTVSATSSKTINGLLGGIVSAGNFKVVIPPLAIRGTATVTVTQPDVSAPVVELHISPETANRFALPVLLVADVSRLSPDLISVSYLSWYNPSTGQWERVQGSSVSLLNLTIQAPLQHFSTYRVERDGKAGW